MDHVLTVIILLMALITIYTFAVAILEIPDVMANLIAAAGLIIVSVFLYITVYAMISTP